MEEKNPVEDKMGELRSPPQIVRFDLPLPQHVPPPGTFEVLSSSSPETSVDEAIEIIEAHLDSGKSFTNAQIDVCTKVLATMLPQSERDMLVEVSEQNKYPLWVGLLAQWRRCVEYGEQYAILTDPDWDKAIDERAHELNGAVVVVNDNGGAKG